MSETPFEVTIRELKSSAAEIRPSELMFFSDPLRSTLNFVNRAGKVSLTELTEKLGFTREEAKQVADVLLARKFFTLASASTEEEPIYESHLSSASRPARRPAPDLWGKIG